MLHTLSSTNVYNLSPNNNRGSWSKEDDQIIVSAIKQGFSKWSDIGKLFSVERTGKQCRERWFNHLDPTLKKGIPWSEEEDLSLLDAQRQLGNSWTRIAMGIPGRSENEVKNRWYSAAICKKRAQMGRKRGLALTTKVTDGELIQRGQSGLGYGGHDATGAMPVVAECVGSSSAGAHPPSRVSIREEPTVLTTQSDQSVAFGQEPYLTPDELVSLEIAELFLPFLVPELALRDNIERPSSQYASFNVFQSSNDARPCLTTLSSFSHSFNGTLSPFPSSLFLSGEVSVTSGMDGIMHNDEGFTSPLSWDSTLDKIVAAPLRSLSLPMGTTPTSGPLPGRPPAPIPSSVLVPSTYGNDHNDNNASEVSTLSNQSSRSNSVVNALNFLMYSISMPTSPMVMAGTNRGEEVDHVGLYNEQDELK